jgi:hypothetical protein
VRVEPAMRIGGRRAQPLADRRLDASRGGDHDASRFKATTQLPPPS